MIPLIHGLIIPIAQHRKNISHANLVSPQIPSPDQSSIKKYALDEVLENELDQNDNDLINGSFFLFLYKIDIQSINSGIVPGSEIGFVSIAEG